MPLNNFVFYQGCVGVDANRNFDFKWGETGSSSLACDEQVN